MPRLPILTTLSAISLLALAVSACGGNEGSPSSPALTQAPAPPATPVPAATSSAPATAAPTPTRPTATSTAAPRATPTAATPTPLPPGASPQPTARPAPVQTVTLTAIRDTTLYEEPSGALSNGKGDSLFAGSTNNGSARRALVAFDLSSIPAGSTVTRADLVLTITRTQTGQQQIAVHRVAASWGEGSSNAQGNEGTGAAATPSDATWVHRLFDRERWTRPGGDFVAQPSATAAAGGLGRATFPSSPGLVADVTAWINTPAQNFGWILIGGERDTQTAKRFASRETTTATDRPQLIVEYLPPAR